MSKINVWHYIFMAKFEILSKKKSLLSNPEISDWKKAFIFLSLLFGDGWDENFKLLLGRAWHRRLLQILRYWPL